MQSNGGLWPGHRRPRGLACIRCLGSGCHFHPFSFIAVTHKHIPALPLYSTCMAVMGLGSPNKAPQGLYIGHDSPQHQASVHCASQCWYPKACSCLATSCACCMFAAVPSPPSPPPPHPCFALPSPSAPNSIYIGCGCVPRR